jgi:hypothetical protein
MTAVLRSSERRRYWLSLAALTIALPAAIAVNAGQSAWEWRSRNIGTPVAVARDAAQDYAGARWQLNALTRLRDAAPGTIVVVAEFDATVEDPEPLHKGICKAVLTDDKGRRWQPAFITSRVVRQGRPQADGKSRCGVLMRAEKGKTVAMAEAFIVPESATGLAFTVTVATAWPDYLVFR